jgi:hypothetical protein
VLLLASLIFFVVLFVELWTLRTRCRRVSVTQFGLNHVFLCMTALAASLATGLWTGFVYFLILFTVLELFIGEVLAGTRWGRHRLMPQDMLHRNAQLFWTAAKEPPQAGNFNSFTIVISPEPDEPNGRTPSREKWQRWQSPDDRVPFAQNR